ncbi:MAG: protein kinase [Myxococcota bacterium]
MSDSPEPVEVATVTSGRVSGDAATQTRYGTPRRSADRPVSDARIAHFVILDKLGQGGMGIVYSAYDERLDRKVAIKVMHPDRRSQADRGRMLHEARAMARLSHPNIITVHEVGELPNQIFIAMEFVRGEDLQSWLTAEPRRWPAVLDNFRRAGRGLAAAHEAGLVHRDFKPHNAMIGEDGSVKVLDFGLAWLEELTTTDPRDSEDADPRGSGYTHTGAVVGTPAFLAPELYGQEPASPRSDQFAFCVGLYFGLYGQYPFVGDTLPSLAQAIIDGELRPPPSGSDVPPWVRRTVLRGLSADPAERFESMEELLATLAEDPGRRRRRRLLATTAIATVFGGGFAVAQLGGGPLDRCPDGTAEMAEAWNDMRKDLVQGSLQSSGSPHADDTWARIEPALDAYADRWIEGRHAACEDHRRGAQSDALYDRRVECLEHGRTGLQTLVEVFEHADPTVVDRAVTAVAGLPPLQRCDDATALLAAVPPPPEAVATEVARVREQLARAKAHEDAGRFEPAHVLADEAVTTAKTLNYPPLLAEARLQRGSTEMAAGRGPTADEDLAQAIWTGIEIGHDEVAARAASLRIYARAELLGRSLEASAEVDWAGAVVNRAHDEVLRGLYLNNAGAVFLRNGEFDRAMESFRASLELRRRVLPPTHPDLALSLANLGRAEIDRLHPAAAARDLRAAAEGIEVALGPRHPYRAMVATMLSSALTELGRWDEAHAELDIADAIHAERPPDPQARYHGLQARGRVALRQRSWSQAHDRFREALDLAEPVVPSELMLADARLGLAQAQVAMGTIDQGLALGTKTFEGVEDAVGPDHPYAGQAAVAMGDILLHAEQPESALRYYERARTQARSAEPVNAIHVAQLGVWIGRAHLANDDPKHALAVLEPSVVALAALVPEHSPALVEAQRELGLAYFGLGDAHTAASWWTRAEQGLAASRKADDPALAWLRFLLARTRDDAATGRREAEAALAVLQTLGGWSDETAQIQAWLNRP